MVSMYGLLRVINAQLLGLAAVLRAKEKKILQPLSRSGES